MAEHTHRPALSPQFVHLVMNTNIGDKDGEILSEVISVCMCLRVVSMERCLVQVPAIDKTCLQDNTVPLVCRMLVDSRVTRPPNYCLRKT